MSLKLMPGRNGKPRKNWYGKITVEGKSHIVNLGVPVRGTIPDSLRFLGDGPFENSRGKAQEKLDRLTLEASDRRQSQKTLETLYEIQTGKTVDYVLLSDLSKRWRERKGPERSENYLKGCDAVFLQFQAYCSKHHPELKMVHQVTDEIAQGYIDEISAKYAPKTVRGHAVTLKGAFRRFSQMVSNPFANVVNPVEGRDEIHRRALTVDELSRLIQLADLHDKQIADAIRCCAYSGLRKGDVMRLSWDCVEESTLRVKTSKTGAEVVIPIFPPMREVLDRNRGKDERFVFPILARIYEEAPHELTVRFKKIAVLLDEKEGDTVEPSRAEVLESGLRFIKASVPLARKARVQDTFVRYMTGDSFNAIAEATGRTKSAISYDLHEVGEGVGFQIVRWKKGDSLRNRLHATRKTRKHGLRRGSRLDWHALRTTFATIALENGMSEGNLLGITGHTSMQTVIRHYRQIREAERKREYGKMPDFFTGNAMSHSTQGSQGEVP